MCASRKRLSEQEAAITVLHQTLANISEDWPSVYVSLQNSFGARFVVEDARKARFDFALAAVAQDLGALPNLFEQRQASRIEAWVSKLMNSPEWGEYSAKELKEYRAAFEEASSEVRAGGNPMELMSAIPARLIHRLLGKAISQFAIGEGELRFIEPILLLSMTTALVSYCGAWKRMAEEFQLVEGDLPLTPQHLRFPNHVPGTVAIDSVVLRYGPNGMIQEQHLSLNELLQWQNPASGHSVCRALLKGPWNGIKEVFWDALPGAEAFMDGETTVYCF